MAVIKPGAYVAGDILGADDLNALPGGLYSGGYAQATSNQTTITTTADATSLTVTWTAVSSRRYRISWAINLSVTGADITGDAFVYCTDGSNNVKGSIIQTITAGEAADDVVYANLSSFTTETGLSGSTTRKIRVAFVEYAGGNTATLVASATSPAHILVEDIGPA
jgi:hypothetical protein